jgi:hypothetical protein
MAFATRDTAHAQREAAARQLNEGKLFMGLLQHRLDRAQRKLDMAEKQIVVTGKLMKLTVERLCKRSLLNDKVHRWGCDVVAGTSNGPGAPSDSEDQASDSSEHGVMNEHEGSDGVDDVVEGSIVRPKQGGDFKFNGRPYTNM